ncbi:MAG: DUF6314 family protein [Paracoccaceae bacterium]
MTPRLADFAGRWLVERAIDDARAGQTGHFGGQATFTPDGEALIYEEEGTLRLGDAAPVHATRRYLWRQDGPDIAVLFPDGRPFHSFAPGAPGADHWCDPDSYRVAYDFARWPDWTARWRVTGPRKDYAMTSRYCRAPGIG